MWLPLAISFLFFVLGAWRFAGVNHPGITAPDRTDIIFNGVNCFLLALLGVVCTLWPKIQSLFARDKKKDDSGVAVVVVDSPEGNAEVEEKSIPSLEVELSKNVTEEEERESSELVQVPAVAEKPAAKRNVVYLTNLKTFLTFVVVVHHVACALIGIDVGLITFASNPEKPKSKEDFRSFAIFGEFFIDSNQSYFMAAFYLISAYFCPKSLDRKGFRVFVLDKLVRLGGGVLLWSLVIGPFLGMWTDAYRGTTIYFEYGQGPCWFVLWLLNFSIIYAALAQFIPQVKFSMPHPLLLMLLGLGLGGVYYGMELVVGDYSFIGSMAIWNFGVALYIPFFTAGIVGGRNDWLQSVEGMKTWVVWVLRVTVVCIWGLALFFISYSHIQLPFGLDGNAVILFYPCIGIGVYAVTMTLALMQLFHQYFNSSPQSLLMRNAGLAAYTVYIIHLWVMNVCVVIFIEILKAADVAIIWNTMSKHFIPYSTVVGEPPVPALLSDGVLWGGFVFLTVSTNLLVWPLAHYFRKLPVLNQIL